MFFWYSATNTLTFEDGGYTMSVIEKIGIFLRSRLNSIPDFCNASSRHCLYSHIPMARDSETKL